MTNTVKTIPGTWYTITCTAAATVTEQIEGENAVLAVLDESGTASFRATAGTIIVETEGKYHILPTKAPVAAGNSSGGTIKFDSTPTSGSTAAVTSGGLYNMLISPINLGVGSTGVKSTHITLGSNITFGGSTANAISIGNNSKVYTNSTCGIAIGYGATIETNSGSCIALGCGAYTQLKSIAIGEKASSGGFGTVCGCETTSTFFSAAFGSHIKVRDQGCTVISAWKPSSSAWVTPSMQTLLYLIGADSPLATTYENGEACLGYVVKDSSGNILACGTRKLSELLTNNTAFAPAALDLDAPAPTPFLPTGITDPIEIKEELTD